MIRVPIRAALVLAALLGAAVHAAPEVPAAVFAALPRVSDVALSPDGALLAWSDRSGLHVRVVIYDISRKDYRRILAVDPTMKLRSLGWGDSDTLLMDVSQVQSVTEWDGPDRRYTISRIIAVDVPSGKSHMLLMRGAKTWDTGADIIALHTAVPHTVVMACYDFSPNAASSDMGTLISRARANSGWLFDLFKVDTRTGKGTLIAAGDQYTEAWVVDAQDAAVARSEWRPMQKQYLVEAKSGAGWRRILQRDDDKFILYGLSLDGKSLIGTGPGKNGWITVWAIALDGSGAKDLLPNEHADVERVFRDRFTGAPVGALLGGLQEKISWFDARAATTFESVAHAFPGRHVRITTKSQDGGRVVAEVWGDSFPSIYYLIDFKTHRADIVGETYPGLEHTALGQVRRFTYAARDGTAIPALLTLPPGATPKGLPLVVLPHDGPEARDNPEFNWLVQFLAVRGYAVLQPEFRGTSGFGDTFADAGRRQWGGLMQDDISDGVKAMVSQGIADPHRICIVGVGFGGYAALAGAAFTPKLYACVVSINGISDLTAFVKFQENQFGVHSSAAAYWRREVGSEFDPGLSERSPINSAADVDAPVLLLHASNDTVFPFSQSQRMANALASLGKPVGLVKLEGDDHWLSREATRLEVLDKLDVFLHQFLK